MRQQGLTVVATVKADKVKELGKVLAAVHDELMDPNTPNTFIDFEKTPTHFARFVLIDLDPDYAPVLLFASNHDGKGDAYLDALIKAGPKLDAIWENCEGYPAGGTGDAAAFKKFIKKHTRRNATYFIAYPGITRESARNALTVFDAIGIYIDDNRARLETMSPEKIAEEIRDFVKSEQAAGRLDVMTETMPRKNQAIPLLAGLIALVIIALLIFVPVSRYIFLGFLVLVLLIYLALRLTERREEKEYNRTHTTNFIPNARVLEQESLEEVIAQNQMTLVNVVKRSLVRRLLLRVFLFVVNTVSRLTLNQGTLGDVRTVHFARWFYTDGGKRLIFNSQFDESWQQYIGAFVDLLPIYLTGIWGNAEGYPPTRNFLFEGATDIEGFMQFIRETQVPSDVFYSAYPTVAAQNIVNAVHMREGLNDLLAGKTLQDTEAWLRRFAGTIALPDQKKPTPLPNRPEEAKVRDNLEDIQGWLLNGYIFKMHIGYLFLKVTDAKQARKWLGDITTGANTNWPHSITTAANTGAASPINIAFTAGGLEALGLPKDRDALMTFPTEFWQGIAEEYFDRKPTASRLSSRSRKLGDTDGSAPYNWDVGGTEPARQFDILLILHVKGKAEDLERRVEEELRRIDEYGGLVLVHREDGHRLTKGIDVPGRKKPKTIFIEHFGFRDGIAEPAIRDSEESKGKHKKSQITIAAGEFVLGYRDQYDHFPPTPSVPDEYDPGNELPPARHRRTQEILPRLKDLGRNGSYVVFRKLDQNVPAFWDYYRQNTNDKDAMIELASKSVGRWPDGTPLTLSPNGPDPRFAKSPANNNFLYVKEDLHGFKCPFASHIRRSNPRDSLSTTNSLTIADRHHIIRRGAPYGPITDLPPWPEPNKGDMPQPDGEDRGLMFFCINTSFRRQFEFVQIAWNNSPRFNGLYDSADPVMGPQPPAGRTVGNLAIEDRPYRLRTRKCPRFTGVKGGAYLFLPSISALKFLARLPGKPTAGGGAVASTAPTETGLGPAPPPSTPDDLTRIEGIGPKIAQVLQEASITTFADLVDTDVARLEQILDDAGLGALANPATWPEQARLAAAGNWDALDNLQDELKGGQRM